MSSGYIDMINCLMLRQFFRYFFFGAIINGFAYFFYLLLTFVGVAPKISMTLLYITCATASFCVNRSVTFSYRGRLARSGVRYIFSQMVGYFINFSFFVIFVDELGYPHQFVQAASIFIVAAFLFVSLKFFVFRSGS